MTHRSESADKKENVLRAPARLRGSKDRDEQHRRSNEEKQVSPAIQNPRRRFRGRGGSLDLAGFRWRHSCHGHCLRSHLRLIIQNENKDKSVLRTVKIQTNHAIRARRSENRGFLWEK